MSYMPKPYLPGILALIAEHVSEDAAVKLAKARGGRTIWIPGHPKDDHALCKIVGLDNAKSILKVLGAGQVIVPCGSFAGAEGRKRRIVELWQAGLSGEQIATELDVHVRTVFRTIEGLDLERQKQLPLT
ncbi:MAG: helix-turn-helix domain-containing protein [Planktomarina sp.]